MKFFKHEGDGHWIGSCVIVCADDLDTAKGLIRSELNSSGLWDEQLDVEEMNINPNHVVYFHSGDY